MKDINKTRRQQFLYQELYEAVEKGLKDGLAGYRQYLPSVDRFDLEYVASHGTSFDIALDMLMLEYTAGAPGDEIKAMYPPVVEAFEKWCETDKAWYLARHPEATDRPLVCAFDELEDIGQYQQLLRLISLGVLLNEGESLRKIAGWLQTERGKDVIVEELLFPYVDDPLETQAILHLDLYDDLVGAIWEESPSESAACMQKFLKSWYKAYRGQPWHDAHLRVGSIPEKPHWANYYGYWAFEAGAMSYLYELDDTPWREHLLYPKDLVDWARSQGRPAKPQAAIATDVLTAYPGDRCPESGDWFAHQLVDKTVFVEKGQPMPGPEFSATGKVIWHLRKDRK